MLRPSYRTLLNGMRAHWHRFWRQSRQTFQMGGEAEFHDRTELFGSGSAGQFEPVLRIDVPLHHKGVLYGNLLLCSRGNDECIFSEKHRFFVRQVANVVIAELMRCDEVKDLRESERELSFILDNTPARLWFKDRDNRVLRANRAAAQWIWHAP